MWNVPGDQQAALRKQVRSRTGHPTQTLARGSLLVFVCELWVPKTCATWPDAPLSSGLLGCASGA
jgi:hypothetical protein